MVSTDAEENKVISERAGAMVPFLRTEETSNDFASTADVLNEVLAEYAKRGMYFDVMCCLYPTAPFVTPEKLRDAYKKMLNDKADSVMPVVQYSFPPQRGNIIQDGILEYIYPEYIQTRSQDLEPIYHDAGQFYFYKVNKDLSFSNKTYSPVIVSDLEVQDIDNEPDWIIAELKFLYMKFGNKLGEESMMNKIAELMRGGWSLLSNYDNRFAIFRKSSYGLSLSETEVAA